MLVSLLLVLELGLNMNVFDGNINFLLLAIWFLLVPSILRVF